MFVDLETLATCPNAAVIQLGWVAANINPQIDGPYELDEGEISFTERSNNMAKRTVSRSTVDWWTRDTLRKNLLNEIRESADQDVRELPTIFSGIIERMKKHKAFDAQHFQIWSRGTFDLPIIKSFYYHERAGEYKNVPWQYWQECDFRTLSRMDKGLKELAESEFAYFNSGQAHTALYDARRDLNTLAAFYNRGYVVH